MWNDIKRFLDNKVASPLEVYECDVKPFEVLKVHIEQELNERGIVIDGLGNLRYATERSTGAGN